MGESCLIKTHVRNPKGEMVESKLFNDLLSYLPSRSLAKEYYAVGTNKEFLREVKDKAEFDENGEITFNSLRKLAKINIKEEDLIDKLNTEIGAGTMSYQEAIAKVRNFNTNSPFNNDFIAMAAYNNSNGQYTLYVTKKSAAKIADLQKTIEKQELRDKLLSKLRSHGVGVKFLENSTGGRYSTENIEQTADGLYNLIQVAHGDNINHDLAEESGHFAIGALGNSPLVERLMNLLDERVQRQILGDEYDIRNLGNNPSREVAGILVGRALEKQLEAKTPWNRLANRIVDLAKYIFSKFSGDDVRIAREQAQRIARDIASGFLSDNFEGNISNAIEYKEVLNHAVLPYNIQIFKKTVDTLGVMAKELEAVASDKLASTVTAFVGTALSGRDMVVNKPTPDSELIAFQGLCQALTDILDLLGPDKEIDDLLNSVDFSNPTDFYQNMAKHGNSLRKVRVFVRNATLIATLLRDAVNSHDKKLVLPGGQTLDNAFFTNVFGQHETINFKARLDDLEKIIKIVDSRLTSKENAYFCRFCEDTYGSKYVNTAAQIIWKNHKLTAAEADKIPISDLLDHLDDDIDIFHRYIGSMSNNPDIIGQIVDKAVKAANKLADDRTIQIQDKLRELQQKFKDRYGITDTECIFEKNPDGTLTGNLITAPNSQITDDSGKPMAVHYGEWGKRKKEFRDKCEEEFKTLHPDWKSWTGFTRGYMWDEFYGKKLKEWHKNNSIKIKFRDESGEVIKSEWAPNKNYKSDQYDKLIAKYPGIEELLKEVHEIKSELDSYLPAGAALSFRAPQFKGTFTNRVQNSRASMSRFKATKKAIRDGILETFCESSEDTDYGDLNSVSSPKDLLGTPMDFEKEKPNRLPMFGINRLDDMSQLSTDIFHSLLSYASMATSYAALSSVVDAVEVGRNALNNRNVKVSKKEKDLDKHTRSFTRYCKYLDKQVYGISATHWGITIGHHKVLLNKVVQAITRLGSALFLGGNVMGGITNTGTGSIEVFKEAMASEYFTVDDWKAAHTYYWKALPSNWRQVNSVQKDDKLSLFMRYFNIKGENRERFRSRYNKTNKLLRFIDSSIYLPYSSGDHYMQSMSYLSIAHSIKLHNTNGKSSNLLGAYKRELNYKGKKKKTYKLEFNGKLYASAVGVGGITYNDLVNENIWLKDAGSTDEYNMLKGLLGHIENSINSPLLGYTPSVEELEYLNKNNLGVGDLYKIKTKVQNDIFKLIWTKDDEIAYMNKAREVNNRLHGIYNNQDKTAWHQNWYTNALLAMKGYALGMLERRISNAHHSVTLDNDVEGSLNTMSKLWLGTMSKSVNIKFKDAFCASFLTPIMSKKVKQRLKDAGFSTSQMANMKRNFMDYTVMILLYMLRFLCAEPPKDEREDDYEPDQLSGLAYYFVTRWIREQEAFNAPWGVFTESATLADLVPVGASAMYDVGTLGWEMIGSTTFDEEDSDFFYQRDHPNGKYEQYEAKWKNHMIRLTPYYKSWYNLNNPYEALESYEFGRKLNSR